MTTETTSDPFAIFADWFAEAARREPRDANAMTLATADSSGRPAARTVLLKDWGRGGFVFYTNTRSRKGEELAVNAHAALLFYWKSLGRQVRIEGPATSVSEAEADAYFATRPRDSRLGAWASEQSAVMTGGWPDFEAALARVRDRFGDGDIPRPPHWSGYRVAPEAIEFWQEGPNRLHVRRLFRPAPDGSWAVDMLFP